MNSGWLLSFISLSAALFTVYIQAILDLPPLLGACKPAGFEISVPMSDTFLFKFPFTSMNRNSLCSWNCLHSSSMCPHTYFYHCSCVIKLWPRVLSSCLDVINGTNVDERCTFSLSHLEGIYGLRSVTVCWESLVWWGGKKQCILILCV